MSFSPEAFSFLMKIISAVYLVFLIGTVAKILLDTNSTSKTLGYILLVIVFPIAGLLFYYAFGINYRHHKSVTRGSVELKRFSEAYKKNVIDQSIDLLKAHEAYLGKYADLIHFIHELGGEKLSVNEFDLLINGEEKYPEVLRSLAKATHHIHMEYYAWENDVRGNQIKDILIKKAGEGVQVRVLYDAYASRKIKRNVAKELRENGVDIRPVIKVKLSAFANRINHRDHRWAYGLCGRTEYFGSIRQFYRYGTLVERHPRKNTRRDCAQFTTSLSDQLERSANKRTKY